jgi:purine-nucleoside phosphorylase
MSVLAAQLKETLDFIRLYYAAVPKLGIILGSGLGNFVDDIVIEKEIEYKSIPHFPVSTVEGHQGKLIMGELGGKKIVCMAGRFHYYEGYTPAELIYPVRVMQQLGIETLLVSNAAGGIRQDFKVGDLMIIEDHISFFISNPLIGKNETLLGPRFPDMSEPYSKKLIHAAESIAKNLGIAVKKGVYCGVNGPTFETRAEYKLIGKLGGDAVGMSTVQEVIAAIHAGLHVFAMSVITDIGIREEENVITHEEVLHAAKEAAPKLSALFRELASSL